MDWALTPDFLSVMSAVASTARKETSCGMASIVKHDRNEFPEPMWEIASQTNKILI